MADDDWRGGRSDGGLHGPDRGAASYSGQVDSVAAGQIRPPQHAEVVDGGFRISGRYRFASGCQHATMMTCGCLLFEDGKPLMRPDGQQKARVMLVPASKVTIVDTWNTTGMRGTGSHDFIVDNVFVPHEESVSMFEPPRCPGPLYLFPPIYLVCHTGVPLGIARAALDSMLVLCATKEMMPSRQLLRKDTQMQETIASTEASLGAARSYAYGTLEDLWDTLCKGNKPSARQRATYRMMMVHCHQVAKTVIATLYDAAATSAISAAIRWNARCAIFSPPVSTAWCIPGCCAQRAACCSASPQRRPSSSALCRRPPRRLSRTKRS